MDIIFPFEETHRFLWPTNMAGLKPGQKYPTPTPGFGDRVFYETLLRQRPDSAMAQEWCVYYGVLSHKEADKLNKVVVERKRNQRMGIATTSPPPKKKSKPTILKEEAVDDPDMMISSGGEAVGLASL